MIKFMPQAVFVSLLAATVTFASNATGFILWITFVGWAFYFLSGHTLPSAVRAFWNLMFGAACAMLIAYVGTSLGSLGAAAFPVAVFGACFLMIMSEEFKFYPFTNRAATQFVGAATFFAAGFDISFMSVGKMSIALAVGVLCGFITVMGRNFIAKQTGLEQPFKNADEPTPSALPHYSSAASHKADGTHKKSA